MSQDSAKKFLKLKDEISEASLEKAQVEGALKQNMKRLQEDFGVSTLEKAKRKLLQLKSQDEKLDEKIDDIEAELEEKYGEL